MRVVPAACAVLALAACAHAWSPFLDRLLRPGAAGERRAGYSAQAELDAVHHLPGWGKPAHGLFSGCGRARFVHVLVVATAVAATCCASPSAMRPAEQRARAAQVRHGERDRRPRPVLRICGGRGGRVAAARAVAQVRARPARAGCWWRALGPLTGRAPRAGSGGPGCSSLAGGFLSELGPYYPTNQPGRLQRNDFTWTQAANIIFLESPAFVGWSYSNMSADAVVGAPPQPAQPPGARGGRRAGLRARAGAAPAQATRAPPPTRTRSWKCSWTASPHMRAARSGWRASPTAATTCARCRGPPGVRSLLQAAGRERAGARRAGAQPGARDRAAPARRARRPAAPQPAGLPRGCAGGGPAGAPRPRSSARAERRGCRAGNAWTDAAVDNGGAVDFWWSHAMISDVRARPRPRRARSPSRESDQRGVRAGDARGRAQDVQFQQHRAAARRARA